MYGLPVKSDTMYMEETLPFSNNSLASFHGGYYNTLSLADSIHIYIEVVEEREWLSNFMEDSTAYHSVGVNTNQEWSALMGYDFESNYKPSKKKVEEEMVAVQRCTHCYSLPE